VVNQKLGEFRVKSLLEEINKQNVKRMQHTAKNYQTFIKHNNDVSITYTIQ
jgi:hypothetical protein